MTQTSPKTKQKKDARDIRAQALKIARSLQTDGHTPIETKAIASGIQRGIEIYLRQQSEKSRELDKRSKKVKQQANQLALQRDETAAKVEPEGRDYLPWLLLALSWAIFLLTWIF